MTQESPLSYLAKAAMTGAALLLLGAFAQASAAETTVPNRGPAQVGDFALKVEPGVALPLTHPQSQVFKVGGGQTIKALWTLNKYLDVGPSATFMYLPRCPRPRRVLRHLAVGGC